MVVLDRARAQLAEERPILFGVFSGREVYAVLAERLGFAEPEHRAERAIDEQRPSLEVLQHDSDGTRVERVSKNVAGQL